MNFFSQVLCLNRLDPTRNEDTFFLSFFLFTKKSPSLVVRVVDEGTDHQIYEDRGCPFLIFTPLRDSRSLVFRSRVSHETLLHLVN